MNIDKIEFLIPLNLALSPIDIKVHLSRRGRSYLKSQKGEKVVLSNILPTVTMKAVKDQVINEFELSMDNKRLVFQPKDWNDLMMLKDCGVKNGDELFLVLRDVGESLQKDVLVSDYYCKNNVNDLKRLFTCMYMGGQIKEEAIKKISKILAFQTPDLDIALDPSAEDSNILYNFSAIIEHYREGKQGDNLKSWETIFNFLKTYYDPYHEEEQEEDIEIVDQTKYTTLLNNIKEIAISEESIKNNLEQLKSALISSYEEGGISDRVETMLDTKLSKIQYEIGRQIDYCGSLEELVSNKNNEAYLEEWILVFNEINAIGNSELVHIKTIDILNQIRKKGAALLEHFEAAYFFVNNGDEAAYNKLVEEEKLLEWAADIRLPMQMNNENLEKVSSLDLALLEAFVNKLNIFYRSIVGATTFCETEDANIRKVIEEQGGYFSQKNIDYEVRVLDKLLST